MDILRFSVSVIISSQVAANEGGVKCEILNWKHSKE